MLIMVGNMLGLYLNYLKVRSINKRELYLSNEYII